MDLHYYCNNHHYDHPDVDELIYSYRLTTSEFFVMPTYDFTDTRTGEIVEISVSISKYDKFKSDNPHLERYYGPGSAPQINCDPIGSNQHRRAFKEVLNKIHTRTAGSDLNKTTEL